MHLRDIFLKNYNQIQTLKRSRRIESGNILCIVYSLLIQISNASACHVESTNRCEVCPCLTKSRALEKNVSTTLTSVAEAHMKSSRLPAETSNICDVIHTFLQLPTSSVSYWKQISQSGQHQHCPPLMLTLYAFLLNSTNRIKLLYECSSSHVRISSAGLAKNS